MRSVRWWVSAVAGLGVLALAGACTSGSGAGGTSSAVTSTVVVSPSGATSSTQVTVGSDTGDSSASPSSSLPSLSTTSSSSTSSTPQLPSATITASPALGAKNLSPSGAIAIKVANGTISALTMTNPTGKVVTGALSADKTSWTLGEVLGFGKTYTVTGTAVGQDGKQTPIKGTYTMLPESAKADSTITPGDGQAVGIAQPVIISFPVEPVDKAAIEKKLKITTTPAVEGSWGWIHHDGYWGVDWRPADYWPAGTKVHVEANLYGLKYADNAYGSSDLTSDFTIGRSQVVYADANSYKIVVKQGCTKANDQSSCTSTVATYDASYGSGDDIGDPNRVTRSGIHVVNELLPVHKMSNPAYGYSNVTEYWDVRISNNGEFIHQNQGTASDQGVVNVSHGCINLNAVNAEKYFKSALIGDPVEVTGTSVKLSAEDGDLFDWTYSYAQWKQFSAL
jgi:lipoprotein-anchoring transpeptidase ErfK/SrfK